MNFIHVTNQFDYLSSKHTALVVECISNRCKGSVSVGAVNFVSTCEDHPQMSEYTAQVLEFIKGEERRYFLRFFFAKDGSCYNLSLSVVSPKLVL